MQNHPRFIQAPDFYQQKMWYLFSIKSEFGKRDKEVEVKKTDLTDYGSLNKADMQLVTSSNSIKKNLEKII